MEKRAFPFINPLLKSKKLKLNHSKKPYLKKKAEVLGFDVWSVDAEFIRSNICEDFLYFGQHYLFKFIPKNEFWIAKEVMKNEGSFYIEHLLIENRLMKKGLSFEDAFRIASAAEKRERVKSELSKKLKRILIKSSLIKKARKKLIKKINGLKIWLVSGEIVRDEFSEDYRGGGHDRVYDFIPKNEIWIDDDIPKNERKFIVLHELKERQLMGKKMNYKNAHSIATEFEDYSRKNPKEIRNLFEKIKSEI